MHTVASGFELESFMCKFKHLVNAGYNANMCFKSSEGRVQVSLDVDLGNVTPLLLPQDTRLNTPRSVPHIIAARREDIMRDTLLNLNTWKKMLCKQTWIMLVIVPIRDRPIHLEPILTDTDSYRF